MLNLFTKCRNKCVSFWKNERGDANMVSIIVIIVIILIVAVIFKDGITNAAQAIMKTLTNWGKTGGKMKP